ncbi:preprotein translocase subunit YajC [Blastococcus sp. SYSU D00820]
MQQYFPLILIALAFVLLIVLPARQRKRMAAQAQALQESLTVGTPVMTTSGLHGTVAAIGDTTIDLEISPGVVVTFVRQAILEVRKPAGAAPETPAPGDDAPGTVDGGPADRAS